MLFTLFAAPILAGWIVALMELLKPGRIFYPFVNILFTLSLFLVFPAYFCLLEYAAAGKTPGKMIMRIQAVNNDGSRLSFKKSLSRNFYGVVPFEFIGILFGKSPGHDRWTRTTVIQKKRTW